MKIILTGATGFVGRGVLMECLDDSRVDKVLSVGRRPAGLSHPKMEEYLVGDFMSLKEADERLAGYDACLYCAGISSVGMKEEEYTHIAFDTTMHFMRALGRVEEMSLVYVSGAGTRSDERGMMWTRVKGRTENELLKMPFKRAFMFRPLIIRAHEGQDNLPRVQRIIRSIYPVVSFLFPSSCNRLEQLGQAMLNAVERGFAKQVVESGDIRKLSAMRPQ